MDSIIVYRNPMEKAFWEGGYPFPMMLFIVVMAVSFFLTYKLLEKLFNGGRGWNQPDWFLWVSGTIGVILGSLAFIWGMP